MMRLTNHYTIANQGIKMSYKNETKLKTKAYDTTGCYEPFPPNHNVIYKIYI